MNLSRENNQDLVPVIKRYMDEQLDHSMGDLAAELLLDFMVERLAPVFYNMGLQDAAGAVQEYALDMEARLGVMEPSDRE
jgi:uncharacterized protein (DUF2164 family)